MIIPKQSIAGCGDTSCERLVSPIPLPKPQPLKMTMPPRRRRVTMLDHGKPNSMAILRRAQQILRDHGVEVRDEILRKGSATTWMGETVLKKLADEEGLVLCGISDCGSCSASTSLDAVSLQKRQVAGIAVLTAPFREVVDRVMAFYETDQALPLIVLEHPMQNIGPEELEARAQALAAAALRMLP